MSPEQPLQPLTSAPQPSEERHDFGLGLPDLPLVMKRSKVCHVLGISLSTWERAKRAGCVIVPPIAGLPNRYSREAVLAAIGRTQYSATAVRRGQALARRAASVSLRDHGDGRRQRRAVSVHGDSVTRRSA